MEVGMHYCGLDVSTKSTHVSIEDDRGRRVARAVVPTTPEGIERALARYVERGLRVAIEAGGQTAWIHDVLMEVGVKQVHVVHPLKVKWIAESKKKTDRVDAELLAHLLRVGGLPEAVHMPSARSRELRGLLQARRQLVQMRTELINGVRALLHQQRVTLKGRALARARTWRAVLVQAAHAVLAVKDGAAAPLQRWHARVARRRGKKTALVALARKLLTIAFHLLREGTTYDPGRVRCAA